MRAGDARQLDPLLVIRAQLGDRDSIDALLHAAARRLRPHLLRILADSDDADDTLQDVLVLLWRRLHQLAEPRAFWAWAFRIASREARHALRRRRRRTAATLPIDLPAHDESQPPDAEALERLFQRVGELPPNIREVVALHYGEGFSLSAVAAIVEAPVGTVKSRLASALATLRKETSAMEVDDD